LARPAEQPVALRKGKECALLAYLVLLHVKSRTGRVVTVSLLALYAVAMGLSRVFLGHHWFTDVVAGFIAGTAWAIVVILAHRLLLRVQQRRAQRSRTGSGI